MKNNLYKNNLVPINLKNKHILRIMKMVFISLFVFISGIFATEANSQNTKISISKDNANIQEVINAIEKQTDYLFIYNKKEVNVNQRVSVHDITSSGTTLRDDIREERFKELCAEGVQHWQDVCRWKTLDQEIKKWYPITRSGAPVYSAKALYFPIPQSEMENNPNMYSALLHRLSKVLYRQCLTVKDIILMLVRQAYYTRQQ